MRGSPHRWLAGWGPTQVGISSKSLTLYRVGSPMSSRGSSRPEKGEVVRRPEGGGPESWTSLPVASCRPHKGPVPVGEREYAMSARPLTGRGRSPKPRIGMIVVRIDLAVIVLPCVTTIAQPSPRPRALAL